MFRVVMRGLKTKVYLSTLICFSLCLAVLVLLWLLHRYEGAWKCCPAPRLAPSKDAPPPYEAPPPYHIAVALPPPPPTPLHTV